VASIALGQSNILTLGNIDISRDWGWAPDFVDGMIKIMGLEEPNDFILSTGVSHTLMEFIDLAFRTVNISNWERYLTTDKSLARPADVYSVVGDNTKARKLLAWSPTTSFEEIVKGMVLFDLHKLQNLDQNNYWKPDIHE
jgi:GDPmannose 4,6-dehydratase